MVAKELFGVLAGALVLAGISVAVINGGSTAQVLNASGSAFSNIIKAATLKG